MVLFTEQKADGERYGYRTPAGTVVIEPRFRMAEDFAETGLAAVVDESGWAYINTKGEVVVRPFVFDNGPDSFSQGLARFERDEKFGFFDESGQVVIQPRFEFALPFSEGLAAVCKGCTRENHGEHWSAVGGNWGYIDRSGRESIPFAYDEAASFEGGRARVVQDGQPQWIGKDGRPQQ
ncbi:MAG TPA: WG repeat-containing protein [Acidobacteriota bacterium]|nr:WG repeat-containing protein [Acidobacteriota bacterium]